MTMFTLFRKFIAIVIAENYLLQLYEHHGVHGSLFHTKIHLNYNYAKKIIGKLCKKEVIFFGVCMFSKFE